MGDNNGSSGEDRIDKVVMSIVALIIGVVLIASAAIPIISSQVNGLSDLKNVTGQVLDISMFQTLIGVTVVLAILGLIIAVVRGYTKGDR